MTTDHTEHGAPHRYTYSFRRWWWVVLLGLFYIAAGIYLVMLYFGRQERLTVAGICFALGGVAFIAWNAHLFLPFQLYADRLTKRIRFKNHVVAFEGAFYKTKRTGTGILECTVAGQDSQLSFVASDPRTKRLFEFITERLVSYDERVAAGTVDPFNDAIGVYRPSATTRLTFTCCLVAALVFDAVVFVLTVCGVISFTHKRSLAVLAVATMYTAVVTFFRWNLAYHVELLPDLIRVCRWHRRPVPFSLTDDTTLEWTPASGSPILRLRNRTGDIIIPTQVQDFDRLLAGLTSRFPFPKEDEATIAFPLEIRAQFGRRITRLGCGAIVLGISAFIVWKKSVNEGDTAFAVAVVLSLLALLLTSLNTFFARARFDETGIRVSGLLHSRFVRLEDLESISVVEHEQNGVVHRSFTVTTHTGKGVTFPEAVYQVNAHAVAQSLRRLYGL